MTKPSPTPGDSPIKAIEDEIEQTRRSLDAAIRDHSTKLAGLYARREISMLAANLVSGIGGFVDGVLAAQAIPAAAAAPAERPAEPAAPAKPEAQPQDRKPARRSPAAKASPSKAAPARTRRAKAAAPASPGAVAEAKAASAPQTATPAPSRTRTTSDGDSEHRERILAVLRMAPAPMAPADIGRAIGVQGIGRLLKPMTEEKLLERDGNGRYVAAATQPAAA